MGDKKIVEETNNISSRPINLSTNDVEESDGNMPEEASIDNCDRNDRDLHVIRVKRLELDSIQKDLDGLMGMLNSFIADSQEEILADEVSLNSARLDEEELPTVTEKQDGPSEKQLKLNTGATGDNSLDAVYVTDGSNPPEINWDAVGPILQKHVADLQRLHNLNQMTNAMVKRIRNVTQINEVLSKNKNGEKDEV